MIDLQVLQQIQDKIDLIPVEEISFQTDSSKVSRDQKIEKILTDVGQNFSEDLRKRICSEFQGLGPLEKLMEDEEITEIMVNAHNNIWFEKSGALLPYSDHFSSERNYLNCIFKICEESRSHLTVERPMAQGNYQGFRLQLIGPEITRSNPILSLRRHPKNPWTLAKLQSLGWATSTEVETIQNWLYSRRNFLVVGPTGCGKTSAINACLQELPEDERVLILEDTLELEIPNKVSQRMLTREDNQRILPDIDLSDLLRQALRLRPDRLVIGEIRGNEAKDLLLALSTGHAGSFGTLHASNPQQALIRLEMLIQLGAPHWNLTAIRRLIQLSLKGIIVVKRDDQGKRKLEGCYEIASLEESGFLIQKV